MSRSSSGPPASWPAGKRRAAYRAAAAAAEPPPPPPPPPLALDESWRAALLEPTRLRWEARSVDRSLTVPQREYAERRAAAIAKPIAPRTAGAWDAKRRAWSGACGRNGVNVSCGCEGASKFRPFGCRQWWLCKRCRDERSPRLGRRIREGLAARFAEATAAWRGYADWLQGYSPERARERRDMRPRFVMLTLTVRHSGDLAEDREAIASGWRKFYKRVWKEIGAFSYAGVWEVTPSDDGHIHAHVAVIWPWVDFGDAREWWVEACPQSERLVFSWKRKDGRPSTPASVANYLGKYLGKGSFDPFDARLNAELSAAMYNKRSVFTSRRFWEPFAPVCKCCNQAWEVVRHAFDTPAPSEGVPNEDPDWTLPDYAWMPPQLLLMYDS